MDPKVLDSLSDADLEALSAGNHDAISEEGLIALASETKTPTPGSTRSIAHKLMAGKGNPASPWRMAAEKVQAGYEDPDQVNRAMLGAMPGGSQALGALGGALKPVGQAIGAAGKALSKPGTINALLGVASPRLAKLAEFLGKIAPEAEQGAETLASKTLPKGAAEAAKQAGKKFDPFTKKPLP